MSEPKSARPTTGRVRHTPPGLVALSAGGGVAFQSASFSEFIAAHVGALPEDERPEALAWLAGFGSALAEAGGPAES